MDGREAEPDGVPYDALSLSGGHEERRRDGEAEEEGSQGDGGQQDAQGLGPVHLVVRLFIAAARPLEDVVRALTTSAVAHVMRGLLMDATAPVDDVVGALITDVMAHVMRDLLTDATAPADDVVGALITDVMAHVMRGLLTDTTAPADDVVGALITDVMAHVVGGLLADATAPVVDAEGALTPDATTHVEDVVLGVRVGAGTETRAGDGGDTNPLGGDVLQEEVVAAAAMFALGVFHLLQQLTHPWRGEQRVSRGVPVLLPPVFAHRLLVRVHPAAQGAAVLRSGYLLLRVLAPHQTKHLTAPHAGTEVNRKQQRVSARKT